MMNDTLYKDLIEPWIAYKERKVLKRDDRWIIALKRVELIPTIHNLLADIGVHTGFPCYKYCACIFISLDDRRDAYERNIRCTPILL
jgi:hypothetical protein